MWCLLRFAPVVSRLRLCLGCVVFVACGGGRDASLMTGTGSASDGAPASSSTEPDDTGSGSSMSASDSASASESASASASDTSSSEGATGSDSNPASAGVESSTTGSTDDDGSTSQRGTDTEDTSGGETGSETGSDTTGLQDGGVLDIVIWAANDCTFVTDPASITVPEGTEFTVNWINHPSSEVEVDVAKIDPFNHVPIIIGMEPGTSYHDDIREWCGDLFTGTFDFRVTSCFDPHYIPVDCGGA